MLFDLPSARLSVVCELFIIMDGGLYSVVDML